MRKIIKIWFGLMCLTALISILACSADQTTQVSGQEGAELEADTPEQEIEPTQKPEETSDTSSTEEKTGADEPAEEEVRVGDQMTNNTDGAELVFVPAEEFLMGSADSDAFIEESPEHTVYLDAYWIYKYEVTNTQFAEFLNVHGNQEEGGGTWMYAGLSARIQQSDDEWVPNSNYVNHPVVGVSWYGAQAYCAWAGGRLPTEAEWEKAARGTDGRIFPWGDENPTDKLAQFGRVGQTVPVGSFPNGASPYGALDMAGNANEWVSDWFDIDYYADSPDSNPTGPSTGTKRVLRGGSYYSNVSLLRTSSRVWIWPDSAYRDYGFRCVISEVP
jgi:formylglycine-generating enzyme required for sulfatase activity